MKDIEYKSGAIRVEKKEFKGHKFIDVRRMYKDDNDELQYTRKGITIPLEIVDKIVKAIKEANT